MSRFSCLFAVFAPVFAMAFAVPAAAQDGAASRYVSSAHAAAERAAIAAFGPFRVLDKETAALVAVTDRDAPQAFAAMLEAYPHITTLEFVEAPGTYDDRANLRLGRMIRAAGLLVHVGEDGSVRSGAVELFVAGASRAISPEAQFAVHGWMDDLGRGARQFPAGAPEHRRYLDYYREMGMDKARARAFYAMTNSVPFDDARWLTGAEMRGWLGGGEQAAPLPLPSLAYLDLTAPLP